MTGTISYRAVRTNRPFMNEFLVVEWSKDGASYSDIIKETSLFVCHTLLKNLTHNYCCKYISETGDFRAIVLKTSDTDVVLMAIHFQHEINISLIINRQAAQKWWTYIDIPAICRKQGEEVYKALPGMHAFSRCDTTSSFCGNREDTFFNFMMKDAAFMSAMIDLGEKFDISKDLLVKCDKCLCCIYKEPNTTSVNETRYRKLLNGAEAHEIPPTQDALTLNICRTNYQTACYSCENGLNAKLQVPSPNGHG